MTPGARIQAAIDILTELETNPRAADRAVREWCTSHRFAGSKDRASIREIVFSAFRWHGAARVLMQSDAPRAIVLGAARLGMGLSAAEIASCLQGRAYDASPLNAEERAFLESAPVQAGEALLDNWPAWLRARMQSAYGEMAEPLMAALLLSAPMDLRVNVRTMERDAALHALQAVQYEAQATPLSPWGIRVVRAQGLAGANIRALPLYKSGAIEIQDEGSQLTALLAGARAGQQVLELCAGGGGKTLALGMTMGASGQIYACDTSEARLKAVYERVQRAGLRQVQTKHISAWDAEAGEDPDLAEHAGRMDLVFLDVPCSGSGAWRRQPDAKWRLLEADLEALCQTQAQICARGARLVKPGGRLVYVTCSVFEEENAQQISAFLKNHPQFTLLDGAELWASSIEAPQPEGVSVSVPGAEGHALQLLPTTTNTDGFFIAILEKMHE